MEFVDSSSSSSDVSDYEVFCQIFQTLHKQHADCGTNEATGDVTSLELEFELKMIHTRLKCCYKPSD